MDLQFILILLVALLISVTMTVWQIRVGRRMSPRGRRARPVLPNGREKSLGVLPATLKMRRKIVLLFLVLGPALVLVSVLRFGPQGPYGVPAWLIGLLLAVAVAGVSAIRLQRRGNASWLSSRSAPPT